MKLLVSICVIIVLSLAGHEATAQKSGNPIMYNDSVAHNNMLSYDFLAPAFRQFTVSYERLFFKGNIGVRIPWSIGFDYRSVHDAKWSIGLEPKFYPLGQRMHTYVFSFLGEFGETNSLFTIDYFYAVHAKNAYVYYPIDRLSFSFGFGVGFKRVNNNDLRVERSAFLEMSIDYRF